jgi:hypothetical protein
MYSQFTNTTELVERYYTKKNAIYICVNTYITHVTKILARKMKGRDHLEDLGMLERILKEIGW